MKYPIDAAKYIKIMRLLYGVNPGNENTFRRTIPLVNTCYAAGLRGMEGFPLDASDLFRITAEKLDWPLERAMRDKTVSRLIPPMIEWFNQAYAQGRRDAANEEGAT